MDTFVSNHPPVASSATGSKLEAQFEPLNYFIDAQNTIGKEEIVDFCPFCPSIAKTIIGLMLMQKHLG